MNPLLPVHCDHPIHHGGQRGGEQVPICAQFLLGSLSRGHVAIRPEVADAGQPVHDRHIVTGVSTATDQGKLLSEDGLLADKDLADAGEEIFRRDKQLRRFAPGRPAVGSDQGGRPGNSKHLAEEIVCEHDPVLRVFDNEPLVKVSHDNLQPGGGRAQAVARFVQRVPCRLQCIVARLEGRVGGPQFSPLF